MSLCTWAPKQPLLALGTTRGNLYLYNHETVNVESILGKHSKRITCGAFNGRTQLALGGDDSLITVRALDQAFKNSLDRLDFRTRRCTSELSGRLQQRDAVALWGYEAKW